jgi:hypothetical protein
VVEQGGLGRKLSMLEKVDGNGIGFGFHLEGEIMGRAFKNLVRTSIGG